MFLTFVLYTTKLFYTTTKEEESALHWKQNSENFFLPKKFFFSAQDRIKKQLSGSIFFSPSWKATSWKECFAKWKRKKRGKKEKKNPVLRVIIQLFVFIWDPGVSLFHSFFLFFFLGSRFLFIRRNAFEWTAAKNV